MTCLVVERVLLSSAGDALRYRVERDVVHRGVDPDEVAGATVGDPVLVHSTSWRYEAPSTVVLTYVVLPDPEPASARELDTALVLTSGDPVRPRPRALHEHHVVAHAVRHVVDLAAADPTVAAVVDHDAALWARLRITAATLTTGLHEQVRADRSA